MTALRDFVSAIAAVPSRRKGAGRSCGEDDTMQASKSASAMVSSDDLWLGGATAASKNECPSLPRITTKRYPDMMRIAIINDVPVTKNHCFDGMVKVFDKATNYLVHTPL